MRIFAVAATLAVTLATQPNGCSTTPKACDVNFAGVTVKAGKVWDTVTAVCDRRPLQHVLQVWTEYKPFDTWDAYDRTATTWTIPGSGTNPDDPGDRPVQLTVSSPCLEGNYRTRAHVKGRGPATPEAPAGIPFEFEDTGRQKFVSAADCAGE